MSLPNRCDQYLILRSRCDHGIATKECERTGDEDDQRRGAAAGIRTEVARQACTAHTHAHSKPWFSRKQTQVSVARRRSRDWFVVCASVVHRLRLIRMQDTHAREEGIGMAGSKGSRQSGHSSREEQVQARDEERERGMTDSFISTARVER